MAAFSYFAVLYIVTRLEFRLLGRPQILVEGQPLELGRKPVVLLALLCDNSNHSKLPTRDTLAQMLWAGKSNALGSLSTALGQIRDVLGFDPFISDDKTRTLQFKTEFSSDWQEQLQATQSENPNRWLESWQALAHEFLGFPEPSWDAKFDLDVQNWLENKRQELTQLRRDLSLRLAVHHLKLQNWLAALPFLEFVKPEIGDPQEQTVLYRMLVLTATNQPERARLAHRELLECLRELGGRPNSDVEAAMAMANANEIAAARGLLIELFANQHQEKPVPFLGRETTLEQLHAALPNSLEGRVWGVRLIGEPGAGKTELARHWIALLDPQKRAYLHSEGFSERHTPAWRTFDMVVRQLVRARRHDLESMPNELRAAIARFVPDLLDVTGDAPSEDERLLLLGIRWLLSDEIRPTLLFLDDLQWIDPASFGLVLELLRKPPPRGMLLIVTQRDTEQNPTLELSRLPELLQREHAGISLELPPLNETAIQELATRLGQPNTDTGWLKQQSGGNPLYLLEMLEADYVKPDAALIPPNVQELIQYRLNTINQNISAQLVLEACAVLGEGSTLLEIKTVTELGYDAVVEGLSALRNARVLRRGDTSIHFNHDLTLGVAKAHLTPERQQVLQLRAARARHDTPELAAQHYWNALQGGTITLEPSQMADISETFAKAGTSQSLRGDMTAGALWYDRALERATTPNTRVRTLTRRARVHERLMRLDEASQDLDRADLLIAGLDVVTRASLLNARANLLGTYFRDAQATAELANRALALLEGLDSIEVLVERGNTLHNLGLAKWLEQDLQNAERYLREALEIRRALGDLDKVGDTLQNLGLVLTDQRKPEAQEVFEEALQLWGRLGNLSNSARTRANLGLLFWKLGKLAQAEQYFETALSTIQPVGEDVIAHAVYNNLGAVRFEQGKFREAREAYQRALKSPRVAKSKPGLALFRTNLVEVEIRLGLLNEAQENLRLGYELLVQVANDALLTEFYLFEGDIFVLLGKFSGSIEKYDLARNAAQRGHKPEREAIALSKQARLESNLELARQAMTLSDNPMTRTALYTVEKDFLNAHQEIQKMNDTFEEARLLLDFAYLTNETHWHLHAIQLLEQLKS
jgi:tetratricopeptide (TPR) repeat protein